MSKGMRQELAAIALCAMALVAGLILMVCLGCAAGATGHARAFNRSIETGTGFYIEGEHDNVEQH